MTNEDRNELVEKLSREFYMKLPEPMSMRANSDSRPTGEIAANAVISKIESLGYEIVKKEHLKEATDAFVLQQLRAGNFTRRDLTDKERTEMQINAFGLPAKPEL